MIDIHSHFFNLKYLPVAGIIRRYSLNIIPHMVAIGVEKLLWRGTESSIDIDEASQSAVASGEREIPILTLLGKQLPEGSDKSIFELTEDESINRILNKITKSDLEDEAVINALDAFQGIENHKRKKLSFDVNVLRRPMPEMTAYEASVGLVDRLLRWIASKIEDGRNYVKWFAFMQNSEHEMVEHLRTIDAPGVKVFVHQLLDIDNFFNDRSDPMYPSFFSYEVQVKKMEKLNKSFPNTLYGMVGFDPGKPNCIEIIDDAIKNKGFKGVKFYPPLGYRAFNDPKFKKSITRLMDYCVENDIALFTHCNNEGFEANRVKNTGYNSNPMYWQKILEQPKYKNLRLCLAHAGGTHGWFASVKDDEEIDPAQIRDLPAKIDGKQVDWNSSYAKIVFKLCLQYPNVYCDAAYLDEVTDPMQRNNFLKRLQKLFKAQPGFSKKIIYGSDWHMLFQEGKNSRYFQDYIELLNDQGFTDENRMNFFDRNARNYLKLS